MMEGRVNRMKICMKKVKQEKPAMPVKPEEMGEEQKANGKGRMAN
jgi:hypothetical protein